jgi:hypothetical protein
VVVVASLARPALGRPTKPPSGGIKGKSAPSWAPFGPLLLMMVIAHIERTTELPLLHSMCPHAEMRPSHQLYQVEELPVDAMASMGQTMLFTSGLARIIFSIILSGVNSN